MATERLQKILARAGYGSRRSCEDLLREGRVTVGGRIAQLGDSADPEAQRIAVDNETIRLPENYTYIMLNKPRGVVSTLHDPEGRKTVRDFVPLTQRIYPIGRLDTDSEGLILLTDDGDLTERLTHPRYEHPRVYRVLVQGEPTPEVLTRWRLGITLDDRPARFDQVLADTPNQGKTWLKVTVHEGRNHLVRRVAAALGYPVLRLLRIAMGPIELGALQPAQWRHLSAAEVAALKGEGLHSSAGPAPRKRFGDRPRSGSGPRNNSSSDSRRPDSAPRNSRPSQRKERRSG